MNAPILRLEEEVRCLLIARNQIMADRSMDYAERRDMLETIETERLECVRALTILRKYR